MKRLVEIESFLEDESYLGISGDSYLTLEGRESNTFTLADHTAVYNELMYKYGGRMILVREEENAKTVFTTIFTNWVNRRKRDIATLLDTWQRDYNPIENYDAYTVMGGTVTDTETPGEGRMHKVTQTPSANWKETVTQTPTNWTNEKTTEPDANDGWKTVDTEKKITGADSAGQTINKVVPFGAAQPVTVSTSENNVNTEKTSEQIGKLKESTEQKGTYKTETEQTGTYETKDELLGTLENEKAYDTTEWRHGNIGVMAAPDLALKQYQQRKIDILDEVLKEFIDKYTVYV